MTTKKKDGTAAYDMLVEQIGVVEAKYGVEVGEVCTDSGGDCVSARRKFLASHPHLLIMPCYAHLINLVVGDMFKTGDKPVSRMSLIVDEVLQLVNWFRNHS